MFFEFYARNPKLLPGASVGHISLAPALLLHVELLLERGRAIGFSEGQAYATFSRVMATVMGAAVQESALRSLASQGSSLTSELGQPFAADFAGMPNLGRLLASGEV